MNLTKIIGNQPKWFGPVQNFHPNWAGLATLKTKQIIWWNKWYNIWQSILDRAERLSSWNFFMNNIWWTISCLNLVLMAKEWNSLIEINLWTPLLHHELYHDFQMLAIWISYYHQMTTIFYVPFSTHLQSYTIILSTIKTQNESCSYVA